MSALWLSATIAVIGLLVWWLMQDPFPEDPTPTSKRSLPPAREYAAGGPVLTLDVYQIVKLYRMHVYHPDKVTITHFAEHLQGAGMYAWVEGDFSTAVKL